MKFLEALRLLGFFIGATLQVFLFVAFKRSRKMKKFEVLFLGLISCLFLWNLGNFLSFLIEHIEATSKLTRFLLRLMYGPIAYCALTIVPSLLLHIHLLLTQLYFKKLPIPLFRALELAIYVPVLFLPWTLADFLNALPTQSFLAGTDFATPLATWFSFALLVSAFLEARVLRQIQRKEERRLLGMLIGIFVAAALLLLSTYRVLDFQEDWYVGVESLILLWSIVLSALLGYAISRYSLLNFSVSPSLGYTFAGILFLMVYLLPMRYIRNFLLANYTIPGEAVDAGMILALFAFYQPVRRWIDSSVNSLFSLEISKFQRLSSRLDEASRSTVEVDKLLRFIEGLLQLELGLPGLQIVLYPAAETSRPGGESPQASPGPGRRILLTQGSKTLGEILVSQTHYALTSQQEAGLRFLVTQIVAAVENCKLTEGKILLERELAERDKLATLGQMAALVAHNIKNPLSSIKTIVQLMQEDEEVGDKFSRDLSLINSEIDRLTSSVTQLLKFSKPSGLVLRELDLVPILQKITLVFKADAEHRGVLLRLDTAGEPLMVRGSDEVFTEVFQNLVVNALEVSPSGSSVLLSTEIRASDRNGHVAISVDDEGPGITPEVRQHIFKPFFTTKQKGTGLGLAVCYRRIMDLSGQIECISPLGAGGGTRFIVTLPLVK